MSTLSITNKKIEPIFLWGSATSAYQVEGGNKWSDWSIWEKEKKLEVCGQAVKHYELFKEDFALAKKLSQNSHRLSLEWARIEPKEGEFNNKEIEHYREVIKTLRSLDLKICLTLYHFTLPEWLANIGGWENDKAVQYFKRYTRLIIKEYGADVDLWITVNEPLVLATEAYWYGHWPPQVRSRARMVRVMKNLCQAHKEAYKLIHDSFGQAKVGLAHNFFSIEPLHSWFILDRIAAYKADKFWNHWIMKLTADCHDFLGVNYYFHQRAFMSGNYRRGFVSFADPKKLKLETSALGWEIYPAGLTDVLVNLWQQYQLPLYVTENGLAPTNDEQQKNFIIRSVDAVKSAIIKGAQVFGYFYWSLLDNFEWDKGYEPKFGLIEVDRKTFVRRPKPAAEIYSMICQSGSVEAALVSKINRGVHL